MAPRPSPALLISLPLPLSCVANPRTDAPFPASRRPAPPRTSRSRSPILPQHPHPSYAHLRRGARLGFARVAATPSTTGPDQTCIPARRTRQRQDARARPCPRPRPVLHFICATRAVVRLATHPQGRRRAREIFNAQGETHTHCACRAVCPAGDELTSPPSPSMTAVGLCQEGLLGCEYARVQARQRIAIAIGTAGVETLMGSAISCAATAYSSAENLRTAKRVHFARATRRTAGVAPPRSRARLLHGADCMAENAHAARRAIRTVCSIGKVRAASGKMTRRTSCVTANSHACEQDGATARRRDGYQQRESSRDAVAKRYHTWGAPGSPLAAVPRRPACCMRSAREHLLTWSDGVQCRWRVGQRLAHGAGTSDYAAAGS
ncbi:hypothetical protein IEO21_10512 [Rhodonia placenta]|uniref:Uncharacterized protein n=1 Tax=Rhodonia placenta TaxID=104341 RepID=A0A8H7NSC3_9APHY|nr:hypothetical protein IEO21_10512 [Postia placenta]